MKTDPPSPLVQNRAACAVQLSELLLSGSLTQRAEDAALGLLRCGTEHIAQSLLPSTRHAAGIFM